MGQLCVAIRVAGVALILSQLVDWPSKESLSLGHGLQHVGQIHAVSLLPI